MDIKNFFSNKTIIIIAFILIIFSTLLSFNLYVGSNKDKIGRNLGCANTLKNMFGILPILNNAIDKVIDINVSITPEIQNIKQNIVRKKEVFNIDLNDFSYEEAPMVCNALGAKLATYDQLLNAHKKGAHWCNYGWSANQMALYPTQKKIWKKLQKGDEESKNICGKPGVNGGYFDNKELKFGVNCYGYKPKPDPSKIVYNSNKNHINEISNEIANVNPKKLVLLNKYKKMVAEGKLDVRPFSNDKWSNYSFKKSSYIINPSYTTEFEDKEVPIVITQEIEEEDKNPYTYVQEEIIVNEDDEPLDNKEHDKEHNNQINESNMYDEDVI